MNLDDTDRFVKVRELEVPWAYAYAYTLPGEPDKERREEYCNAACGKIRPVSDPLWWAFRITVENSGRLLDVGNVAKLIIDAFCTKQITDDKSALTQVGLYDDDTLKHVRVLQVVGEPGPADRTKIEVFACIKPNGLT